MTSSVTARLRQLCEETLARLDDGPERAAVRSVHDRLSHPLRLAVAGPVSSGKSTLVNALLGQRVAPVGAGETTRVVTWYRYGVEDRATVHLRDGQTLPLGIDDGRLPRDLPRRPDEIDRVVVDLTNERLRRMQVVDTPGLNTTSDHLEEASRRLLGVGDPTAGLAEDEATRDAVGQVDALVFLLPHARARDVDVLDAASRLLGGTALSGLNTVGVVSRIDGLGGDDEDPWPAARRLADRLRSQLRSSVATIIPVVGLLAETAACGRFTEGDAAAVRALAALDEDARLDAFADATQFLTSTAVPLDDGARRRLFDQLALYGLSLVTRAAGDGSRTAAAIVQVVEQASGFGELLATIERQVMARADLLTAHAALAELRRLSYGGASGTSALVLGGLRDPLERVELDSEMHRLRLLDCLAQLYRGELRFPQRLGEELERLALRGDPAARLGLDATAGADASVAAAVAAASTWVTTSNDPRRSPAERSAARAVRTALELLVSDLTAVERQSSGAS